ncbi:hypothetical protein [Magnetospirillum sp. UT-4]|uniref:hypothetical protein n=1 Tax=Magnetospirillum sp. UT-4 TaxID=2681467 RepID=UPI0013835743|nr:hypothetical protein [Magnetospirillum sp. UT-4]CAA7626333.1 hypothetical protein MTBUT4_770004 [Magnetospirillum sp. UT-4]
MQTGDHRCIHAAALDEVEAAIFAGCALAPGFETLSRAVACARYGNCGGDCRMSKRISALMAQLFKQNVALGRLAS